MLFFLPLLCECCDFPQSSGERGLKELRVNLLEGIPRSGAETGASCTVEKFTHAKTMLLVSVQTETCYRDEKNTWCSSVCCTCCWLSACNQPPRSFLDISSSCPLRRCPSWRCLASLLPWLRQWLLPRSAGSSPFRTSCCLRWSPGPPGDGSHGTFSVTQKRTSVSKHCLHPLQQEVQVDLDNAIGECPFMLPVNVYSENTKRTEQTSEGWWQLHCDLPDLVMQHALAGKILFCVIVENESVRP